MATLYNSLLNIIMRITYIVNDLKIHIQNFERRVFFYQNKKNIYEQRQKIKNKIFDQG